MSLEKTKIELLSHSKNMLNSAESGEWEILLQLDIDWQQKLESAIGKYGSELDVIGSQLLDDNQRIQDCLGKSQKTLTAELRKNTHATSALKKYLK